MSANKLYEAPYGSNHSEEDVANAHLIAAAPELLEACESYAIVKEAAESIAELVDWDEDSPCSDLIRKLRNVAIAMRLAASKARGG